ncbi:MAG: M48 family metalloprotease [Firmicutes bacterium]|nr:M48 family metalloprotease [Bacillota bacterium]
MKPTINLYQQIAANKRKTVLILFGFGIFAVLLALALSAYFELPPVGTVAILSGMAVLMLLQYSMASSMVLRIAGARPARREEYPFIYHTVEGLAIAAGIPAPKCYIIDTPAINAFATGRNPQEGVVALTTGLIQRLNNEEIEGVIAHEIAHIRNYDIRLATIAIAFVGIVAVIRDLFVRSLWFGGGRSKGRSKNDRNRGPGIFIAVGLIFIILAPIFSRLLQLALSRRREYAADSTAAWLTRNPQGLANALRKIAIDPYPLRQATESTASLYIVNPLNKLSMAANSFSTHPPIEKRIELLEQLAYKY